MLSVIRPIFEQGLCFYWCEGEVRHINEHLALLSAVSMVACSHKESTVAFLKEIIPGAEEKALRLDFSYAGAYRHLAMWLKNPD